MKKRTTITVNPALYQLAQQVMAQRHFDDFSGFIEQLLREEVERRDTPSHPALLAESPQPAAPPPSTHTPSSQPVRYPRPRRKPPQSAS